MFGNLPDFLPFIKAGRIKAIGTTYLTRAPLAPEIPTIAEQGYPKFETDSWYGLVAPSSMSKAAIERMNQVVNRTLQEPGVKKSLGDRGIEIIGGTPEKFKEHIQSEIAKYERIVKSSIDFWGSRYVSCFQFCGWRLSLHTKRISVLRWCGIGTRI
jgi:tripartite-type tricarboxylate transporter receptor subunit TctC